ncbi:MAG: PcfJ domain-containing protein, partial [Planctomycetaceae bacterium]|nr:PcfJ domain-containing protein [Planctomycetaceae bacterium]
NEFWTSVIRWFIRYPEVLPQQTHEVIEYIDHRKFNHTHVYREGKWQTLGPADPNLTMKDRKPSTLLEEIREWRFQNIYSECNTKFWDKSGIAGFCFEELNETAGTTRHWKIQEINSIYELVEEGSEMRNCVADYAQECAEQTTSIWSLQVDDPLERGHQMTIEVSNSNLEIVQARAYANRGPSKKHRKILKRWANEAGLTINSAV